MVSNNPEPEDKFLKKHQETIKLDAQSHSMYQGPGPINMH